jgi:hypothetical protein
MEVHMIRSKLGSLFVWSAGTFGLALAVAFPSTSNAVDDANSPALVATIVTPHITVNGIEVSVATDSSTTRPSSGEKQPLRLVVTAVNKADSPSSGDFTIQMESTSVANAGSRVLPQPTQIYSDKGSMVLNAGASKTFTFTPSSVPTGKIVRVKMSAGNQSALMLSLGPKPTGFYGPIQ